MINAQLNFKILKQVTVHYYVFNDLFFVKNIIVVVKCHLTAMEMVC